MRPQQYTGPEILNLILKASFEPLGWFVPEVDDNVPDALDGGPARLCLLVGNAGPAMFARFCAERDQSRDTLDDWTRDVLQPLAADIGARAIFPFDRPYQPILTWARRGGAGHVSALGMNIHRRFGLWHGMRAAFIFGHALDLPLVDAGMNPCDTCVDKPCLLACPVGAYSAGGYDVDRCRAHVASPDGAACATGGCKSRMACPVGTEFHHDAAQTRFHMAAFAPIVAAKATRN